MTVGAALSSLESLAAVYSRERDERATQLSVQFALARVESIARRYRSKRAAGDVLAAADSAASVPPPTAYR